MSDLEIQKAQATSALNQVICLENDLRDRSN